MKKFALTLLVLSISSQVTADANDTKIAVTVDNFPRAESDTMLQQTMHVSKLLVGNEAGELGHFRAPFPIDSQPVIRMNRDTLYSSTVLDLTKPVTVTLSDIGGRYQSMHVVNQDHYMFAESHPGTYTLTQEKVGSQYALVTFRTLVNSDDEADIKLANEAQDTIKMSGAITGWQYEAPNWDKQQLTELRQLLSQVSMFGVDPGKGFGIKGEVDPIHYLLASASGWGGLPKAEAMYEISNVDNNDGSPYKATFTDVPVDAFWSVTVYNKEGYIEKNDSGAYSFNNLTADTNTDGATTIHFGACEDKRVNCLPILDGWNYAFRYYKPQSALLSGEWKSPEVISAD